MLAPLTATVGADDARARDLGVMLDVASGDIPSLAARIAQRAPELGEADAVHVAQTLVAEVAAHPVGPGTPFPQLFAAAIAASRAAHVSLVRRASATLTPVRGVPWAILAVSGGAATATVAMCSDTALPTLIDARESVSRGLVTFAMLGHCAAFVAAAPARFDIGVLAAGLASGAAGATRVFVEIDGALVGVGGTLVDGGLRVTSASQGLIGSDLARAGRKVVLPLDALGTRTFPPPTLAVPVPASRRDAAITATAFIEGVHCSRSESGVSCSLESYESVERLGDAAYAIFAAH